MDKADKQKISPREAGVIHILAILILLAGIIAGVYLVQQTQIFRPRANVDGVNLSLQPSRVDVASNEEFELTVFASTGNFEVSAAEIHIGFDPDQVEVRSIRAGDSLPLVLKEGQVNGNEATITVGATLGSTFRGNGTVAILRLVPRNESISTTVELTANTKVAALNYNENVVGSLNPSAITRLASSPMPTPGTAKFSLLASSSSVNQGQEVNVRLYAQSDTDAANLFSAKLNFPSDKLEIVKVDKVGSFVGHWTEDSFDNNLGNLSLIGGVSTPGHQTTGSSSLMANVVFKAKQIGAAGVNIDSSSQIFRNSDNANIFSFSNSTGANISITQPSRPTPSPSPSPSPSPIPSPSPTPSPQPIACNITSAVWNTHSNPITEGSVVNLTVNGQGDCDGKTVSFEVLKTNIGILPPITVRNNPPQARFVNNIASSPWVVEYTPNGPFGFLDPPNYFFNITLERSEAIRSADPTLGVQRARTFVKGDGNQDGGVSLVDLSVLFSHFNKQQDFPREIDINDDNSVNTIDYSSILEILRQSGVLRRE